MPRIRTALRQAICILALSAVLGFTINAVRQDGVPVLQARSVVEVSDANGTIALKDALVLSMSGRALFLDARSHWEYEQGHIRGALPAPPEDFEYSLEQYRDEIEAAENIITYCDGELCKLSHELAARLKDAGFESVYVLENGWTMWNNEGLPTESGQAPAE
ncbi:MAG: rhodanese-like domain-containing protein [Oceanidesulfovibrio sp.]